MPCYTPKFQTNNKVLLISYSKLTLESYLRPIKNSMSNTRTYSPVRHVPATAVTQLATTRRCAQYAEIYPLQPLKGHQKPRAASVSYPASVPSGHAGCGLALSYRASSPDGESLPFGIEENPSVTSAPTANYSLLTADWTFTFSAKEKDSETGLSYFGSRYYSSDLSIWLSVDPMSDKYASLSPYTYCANNPVKLVDPNGEEIVIEWGGMKCYYSEGRLYTDREFKNEYVAEEGSFFHKAQTTLNTIADTKTGKTLVNGLANDTEFKVKIIEGEDSGFEPLTKSRDPYNEANAEITWNTSGGLVPVEGGMLRNGVTSLAHELCHGYDYMKNTYSVENGPGGYGDIKICDWKAVFHENQIRQELGLPLRTHYNKNKAQTKGTGSSVLHGKTPFLPPGISPLF